MRRRRTAPNGERLLGDVLLRSLTDFTPAHPSRAPWHQPGLDYTRLEHAVTDNRATVNLAVADRVKLVGLERPTHARDVLELRDWTPAGWGVG